MVERKDRRHPGPEVVATRPIARVAKLRHDLVPPFRDVSIVDTDLGWMRRESISGQRRDDQVEIIEHRQHVHIIEESARPAVCEDGGIRRPEAARLYTKWMPSQVKWSKVLSL